MTTNRLVLCFRSLMLLQISSSVAVQPSCLVLPHIPWLSGVAELQRKVSGEAVATVSGVTTSG
jgi:hypothetical protein